MQQENPSLQSTFKETKVARYLQVVDRSMDGLVDKLEIHFTNKEAMS
jgi:hypothetical protein